MFVHHPSHVVRFEPTAMAVTTRAVHRQSFSQRFAARLPYRDKKRYAGLSFGSVEEKGKLDFKATVTRSTLGCCGMLMLWVPNFPVDQHQTQVGPSQLQLSG